MNSFEQQCVFRGVRQVGGVERHAGEGGEGE
jgi:hypothetical protein